MSDARTQTPPKNREPPKIPAVVRPAGPVERSAFSRGVSPSLYAVFCFYFYNLLETGRESPCPDFQISPLFAKTRRLCCFPRFDARRFAFGICKDRWASLLRILSPQRLFRPQGFPLLRERALCPPVTEVANVASLPLLLLHSPSLSPLFLLVGFLGWMTLDDLGWVAVVDVLSKVASACRL